MKISARNVLSGKVTELKNGVVNAQVSIDIGGGNIVTSMITVESVQNLGIEVGGDVHVVIKASDVMLAID